MENLLVTFRLFQLKREFIRAVKQFKAARDEELESLANKIQKNFIGGMSKTPINIAGAIAGDKGIFKTNNSRCCK